MSITPGAMVGVHLGGDRDNVQPHSIQTPPSWGAPNARMLNNTFC